MALINCQECGIKVSNKAFDCPQCGAKLKTPKRSLMGKSVIYLLIAFNILMLLWLIFGLNITNESIETLETGVERASALVGKGLSSMIIIFMWLAGDVILVIIALATRPKK